MLRRARERNHEHLAPLVSLTLYLASTTREIRSGTLTKPVLPQAQHTRRDGARIFPPAQPRVWPIEAEQAEGMLRHRPFPERAT
jgi:hypothetical protein